MRRGIRVQGIEGEASDDDGVGTEQWRKRTKWGLEKPVA